MDNCGGEQAKASAMYISICMTTVKSRAKVLQCSFLPGPHLHNGYSVLPQLHLNSFLGRSEGAQVGIQHMRCMCCRLLLFIELEWQRTFTAVHLP